MKRVLYIICISILMLSCERVELTYNYSPYCDIVVNLDWSNMSEIPTGMTVRAYPQDGSTPTVYQSNAISSATLSLPAGVYNILVFNQVPADFGTVSFRGLDLWETAEVYANENTSASWATNVSRSSSTFVREPEDVAVATYLDIEISDDMIDKSTEQYRLTKERIVVETLDLKPKVVVKRAFVRVQVDGIKNLLSTRAVLTGMADCYNFSTQQSGEIYVSHLLEEWTIEDYEYNDRYGETNIYFMSFGIPTTTTSTRATSDWSGSIDLQMLLIDNQTIIEHSADITNRTTSNSEEETKSDTDTDIDIDISVEIGFSGDDDDPMPYLPDVLPSGDVSSAFDATVEDWGDEESYDIIF
ncbi:MAG: DUF5119 domain-containing protein [Rikenellaceae bacterium]